MDTPVLCDMCLGLFRRHEIALLDGMLVQFKELNEFDRFRVLLERQDTLEQRIGVVNSGIGILMETLNSHKRSPRHLNVVETYKRRKK